MKLWWCVECQAKVELGKHGRCGMCGSEAVDLLPEDGELNRSASAVPTVSDSASACS
jgi:rRNA maturation endonuclease Nob1